MKRKQNSHLTYEERCQLQALLQAGISKRQIARQIGVNASTISREVNRNISQRGYRQKHAHECASERHKQASSKARKMTAETIHLIKKLLVNTDASPDQISGRLKDSHGIFISHERIYQWIWEDKRLGGTFYTHLRRRAKKYNKRKGKEAGRGCIPNRVDIKHRPAVVEKKKRLGDLELDTIIGSHHEGAILSIVDRSSKFTFLEVLKHPRAKDVTNAMIKRLKPFRNTGLVKTYTSDNGKEFSNHQEISKCLGGEFYFAQPYCPWQRGLNEHTNGLVRQYLPKGTSFSNLHSKQVAQIEYKLNHRPRKILNYKTPAEVFYGSCPNLSSVAFRS